MGQGNNSKKQTKKTTTTKNTLAFVYGNVKRAFSDMGSYKPEGPFFLFYYPFPFRSGEIDF